jgi:hypothetical protein
MVEKLNISQINLWMMWLDQTTGTLGGHAPGIVIVLGVLLATIVFLSTFRHIRNANMVHIRNARHFVHLRFLVINSQMDETWQILHHICNVRNPFAITGNWLTYLYVFTRSHILQRYEISLIHGAQSLRDLNILAKIQVITVHVIVHITMSLVIIGMLFGVVPWFMVVASVAFCYLAILAGSRGERPSSSGSVSPVRRYSALVSPYRRYARVVGSLGSVVPGLATYIVRRKGWSVLMAMVMGLEGYRYRVPVVEQHPSCVPKNRVKYESMPEGAEQRALAMRNAWIGRHFGDVTQTLSKMVVTAADLSSLLRAIEADQSLVHAAYYTDDECIARIADWIAGRG